MDFQNKVKELQERVLSLAPSIQTEEATKMSLIVPFFSML